MKYIIESNDVIGYTPKYAMLFGDGYMIQPLEDLEVLNSDYINEHFGQLQDDAYQKGFEDGKKEAESSEAIEQAKANAFNKGMLFKEEKIHDAYKRGFEDGKWKSEDGCTGCKYEGKTGEHLPCEYCMNSFKNQWTAKDDKIEVGDEVIYNGTTRCVVVFPETEKRYASLFDCDGNHYSADHRECKKTGRHFDIASILEEMRHD